VSSLSEELTTGYGLLSSVTLSAKILDTWPETEIFLWVDIKRGNGEENHNKFQMSAKEVTY
jgi:hypothetical protein